MQAVLLKFRIFLSRVVYYFRYFASNTLLSIEFSLRFFEYNQICCRLNQFNDTIDRQARHRETENALIERKTLYDELSLLETVLKGKRRDQLGNYTTAIQ